MDAQKVKGYLKKYKDVPGFAGVYRQIETEFKGKFPCCQPLDKKYCAWFFDLLWGDDNARATIKAEWHGEIVWHSEGAIRRLYL